MRSKFHLKFLYFCFLFLLIKAYSGYSSNLRPMPESRAHDLLVVELFWKNGDTTMPNRNDLPINVDVEIYLEHFDFHKNDGTFHFVVDLVLSWNNQNLRWDPLDYTNITDIPISTANAWIPDIEVFNNVPEKFFRTHRNGYLVLSHTGQLIWADTIEMNIHCKPVMYNWPYDTHICQLKLGSWTYNALEMTLSTKNSVRQAIVITSVSAKNLEYRIIHHYTDIKLDYYECCNISFASIDYEIKIQHKASYAFIFRITAMTVVILNLLALCMEVHCVLKIWLNGFNLLIITMHLIYFANQIGNLARDTPYIVIFFNWSFFSTTLSQLIAVFCLMATHARFMGKLPARYSKFVHSSLGSFIANKSYILQQTIQMQTLSEDVQPISSDLLTPNAMADEWIQLAVVIERMALFLLATTYLVMASICVF